ncbi:MAG: hypothetical protein ACYC0X_04210 [Pirellulaceae bacterium]
MMYEFLQPDELRTEAKQLLRYRLPLILAVLVNFLFVVRLPLAQMRAESAVPLRVQIDAPAPPGPAASTPLPRRDAPRDASIADAPPATAAALSPPSVDVSPFASTRTWRMTAQRLIRRWSAPWRETIAALIGDRLQRPAPKADTLSAAEPSAAEISAAELLLVEPPAPAHAVDLPPAPRHDPTPISEPVVDAPAPVQLTMRNAQENEGPVIFLVDGRVCELQPGEAHEFAAGTSWRVQFHRGGSFGNVERTLAPGNYRFVITHQGWDLTGSP